MTWEQRWHPLREEWVIVAAHRQDRPWLGNTAGAGATPAPRRHDPSCFLCPGNRRVSGAVNPAYTGVYVFDNDHPCVAPDAPDPPPVAAAGAPALYRATAARGVARVVCYSPAHDLTLAELDPPAVDALLGAWQEQVRELGARPEVNGLLMFENKGEVVGVSNPHPHGQIYATSFVWKTIEIELAASERHLRDTGKVLLQAIIAAEREDGRRVIAENDGAIAFLPYFARHAYELYVAPKRTVASIADLDGAERGALGDVLKRALVRCDNLWRMPFPYVLVLHQAPTDGRAYPHFHFHIQIHPPLRKPHLLKYLAGPEIGGGNFLSDTSPEDKAAELRAQSEVHYRAAGGGTGAP